MTRNGSLIVVGDCIEFACALGSTNGGIVWDDIGPTASYPDAGEEVLSMYWHGLWFLQNNDAITTNAGIMVVGMTGTGSGDNARFDAAGFVGQSPQHTTPPDKDLRPPGSRTLPAMGGQRCADLSMVSGRGLA